MLELTGVASMLRGASFLYWTFAVGILIAAILVPKAIWLKVAGAAVVLAVFGYVPVTQYIEHEKYQSYSQAAWAYFKQKCEAESGEKIYKNVAGIRNVLLVKPLPYAKEGDLYEQFWYGDPYSNSGYGSRAEYLASSLTFYDSPSGKKKGEREKGLDFVEIANPNANSDALFKKYFYVPGERGMRSIDIQKSGSRFGLSWEDISEPAGRNYWIAGSRLRVIDLLDNSVVAERVGFYIEAGFGSRSGARVPWRNSKSPRTTCPEHDDSYSDRWFVLRVLNPNQANENGK